MASKSPFDKRIFKEWERLIDSVDPVPTQERAARSAVLYASCFGPNGQWVVSVDDATLVSSLQWTVETENGNYEGGAQICRRFLAHPRPDTSRYSSTSFFRAQLGVSLFLSGCAQEGIEELFAVLRDGPELLRSRRVALRNVLLCLLDDQTPDGPVDPLLRPLLAAFYRRWKGEAFRARRALRGKTYGDPFPIVMETGRNRLTTTAPPAESVHGSGS